MLGKRNRRWPLATALHFRFVPYILIYRHVFFVFYLLFILSVSTFSIPARAEGSAVVVRDHAKRAHYENSDPLGYAFVPLST